jgi:2',3'-cyclic-nucleotide 2'-phosphodiesterase (5'-nucleotidase family)
MRHAQILLLTVILSLFQFSSCTDISGSENGNAHIVILYTNDEHGWMEANDNAAGAAGMFGLWKEKEGYREDGNFLILSGGDMWTGPAISTWFEGESMVDVMNTMHYDAATVGSHEFDFKIEGLRKRHTQSKFPYISANLRNKSDGKIPDFVDPYIIKEIDGIKIGIIGLTTTSTPRTTFPDNVVDYDFIPYLDALNEIVPLIKKDGAEFLMIDGHICSYVMKALAPESNRLGISLITGGLWH